ncbi:unnamed protein product, partial [Prorocentrum cordatum]
LSVLQVDGVVPWPAQRKRPTARRPCPPPAGPAACGEDDGGQAQRQRLPEAAGVRSSPFAILANGRARRMGNPLPFMAQQVARADVGWAWRMDGLGRPRPGHAGGGDAHQLPQHRLGYHDLRLHHDLLSPLQALRGPTAAAGGGQLPGSLFLMSSYHRSFCQYLYDNLRPQSKICFASAVFRCEGTRLSVVGNVALFVRAKKVFCDKWQWHEFEACWMTGAVDTVTEA